MKKDKDLIDQLRYLQIRKEDSTKDKNNKIQWEWEIYLPYMMILKNIKV